jgi:hypothetical protein
MRIFAAAAFGLALLAFSGCENQKAPPAGDKGGVEVHAPGVDVNAGKDGVKVDAPNANVDVERKK